MAALLFVMSLAKGMVWVSIIPIGQNPDEPVHAEYVDSVATHPSIRQGPREPSAAIAATIEASQALRMPFAPTMKAPFDPWSRATANAELDRTRALRDQPGEPSVNSAYGYPPLYYASAATVVAASRTAQYDTTWFLERSLSVLIASITLVVQFLVLLRVFPGYPGKALLASLALALLPMYSAMESAINPEVLMVFWGSLILLVAMQLLRSPYSSRTHVLAGLIVSLSLLTKPSGIVFIAPYACAAIIGARHSDSGLDWRRSALRAVAFLAPLVLVYGTWTRLPARPGGALDPTSGWPGLRVTPDTISAFADHLAQQGRWRLSDSYWGVFGWLDAPLTSGALSAGFWFTVVALVAFVIAALRREVPSEIWVALVAVVSTLAMVLYLEYLSVLAASGGFAQGRYLFSVVVAVVALQVWSFDWALSGRRWIQHAFWLVLPVGAATLHVAAIAQTVIPRYFL